MNVASDRSNDRLRLALVGDLHDYHLGIWPWELLGKPLAGQMNLWLNRRKKFDRSLIDPVVDRILDLQPNLVLFSGDLTTTARQREFRSIRARLQRLCDAIPCRIVAGNHDRYTATAVRKRRIELSFAGFVHTQSPHMQQLIENWTLIAVDSAVPRWTDSRGRIGDDQIQAVEAVLTAMSPAEAAVVLVHYPFGKPPQLGEMKPGHRLIDEAKWRNCLASARGRVIVVHGHVHLPWIWKPALSASDGQAPARILDVNAGSPTMVSAEWPSGQGFWILEIERNASQPITLEHHVRGEGGAPIGMDESISPRAHVTQDWIMRRITLSV